MHHIKRLLTIVPALLLASSAAQTVNAQTITAAAEQNFVSAHGWGDVWHDLVKTDWESSSPSSVGLLYSSTYPIVTGAPSSDYYSNHGDYVHTSHQVNGSSYGVDLFSRIQDQDLSKNIQNFVDIYSDSSGTLEWMQHLAIPQRLSNPIWTAQNFYGYPNDSLTNNHATGDWHVYWACIATLPASGNFTFNAMHEIHLVDTNNRPFRVQVEVRQSTNQGTAFSQYTYTDESGLTYFINGFDVYTDYPVWTVTLDKKSYGPGWHYDSSLDLSQVLDYLVKHPNVWNSNISGWHNQGFPQSYTITEVDTGVETWNGDDGSAFQSSSCYFWRQ
jgi:hypothetical protein